MPFKTLLIFTGVQASDLRLSRQPETVRSQPDDALGAACSVWHGRTDGWRRGWKPAGKVPPPRRSAKSTRKPWRCSAGRTEPRCASTVLSRRLAASTLLFPSGRLPRNTRCCDFHAGKVEGEGLPAPVARRTRPCQGLVAVGARGDGVRGLWWWLGSANSPPVLREGFAQLKGRVMLL